ncbi:MAG: proteasome assembly chaperone family protein [Thermoplasmata archaeon]|nr:MAG: proteasome assembly chaperone family protein [Thermoplasmata archaeon]RLF27122.1 MAG: proteasome assembly chaperone family protein [Thermoplasmata archaeon]
MDDVELIEFEKVDLKGGTVIAGFPSIGLVSTVAANYLIDALGLKQVGALHSRYFPTLSVVHSAEPLSPVRIYAGIPDRGQKVAIFVSEFRPKPNLITPIAEVIMKWVKEKGCKFLISPEGMVVEGKEDEGMKKDIAYAIGSTEEARNLLVQMEIPQFKNGIIAGVSGVLLNKGKHENVNVVSILAEAHPNYPDARAAAAAIEVIALLLGLDINVAPLYEEAERIEKQLQTLHKQAKPVVTADQTPGPMYG